MKGVRVHGNSMWPFLRSGDLVVLGEPTTPVPGRLIARQIDGDWVVHRQLADGTSKGDRNVGRDPGSSDSALPVIAVLPRGQLRGFQPSRFPRLERLQAALSLGRANADSHLLRRFFLAGSIAIGIMMRALGLAIVWGGRHVVWKPR